MKIARRGLALLKSPFGLVVAFGLVVLLTHPLSAKIEAYGVKLAMMFASPTPAPPPPPLPQVTPAPVVQPIQQCETHGADSSCLQNVRIQHNFTQKTLIFQDNSLLGESNSANAESAPEPEITDEPESKEAEEP